MKYINIRTVEPDTYQVWVCKDGTETVVCREGNQIDFNRKAIGLRVKKSYQPPKTPPGLFTRKESVHVAHTIGRYVLDLGDFVYAYTYLDGLNAPKGFFNYVD